MLPDAEIDAIAVQLEQARLQQLPVQRFTAQHPGFDTAAGLQVAQRLQQRRVAGGARVVGRKIGFTNRALWPVYGVDEPIWGAMYDTTVLPLAGDRGACALAGLAEPKIEPEIVLHFAAAPRAGDSAAQVLQCIDRVAHGFEIVQSPYPGWAFGTADAVAAGALHGLLLLGTPVPVAALGPDPEAALASFTITLANDGQPREQGRGANVLGSPLAAVMHLLQAIDGRPGAEPLRAGEWVSTGTLTAAWPVTPGQTWSTHIDGLALPGLTVDFHL